LVLPCVSNTTLVLFIHRRAETKIYAVILAFVVLIALVQFCSAGCTTATVGEELNNQAFAIKGTSGSTCYTFHLTGNFKGHLLAEATSTDGSQICVSAVSNDFPAKECASGKSKSCSWHEPGTYASIFVGCNGNCSGNTFNLVTKSQLFCF